MLNASTSAANSLQGQPSDNLMSNAERLNERLGTASERLQRIADTLLGNSPRDASGADKVSPAPNMARHVESGHALVTRIEAELQRIENRL